jgi:CysZ protein
MIREFGHGVTIFFRGFGQWVRSPRLMLIGAVPALIVGAVVLAAFVLAVANIDPVVLAITGFADGWDSLWRNILRVAVAAALLVALLLLAVSTFTALTLAVGDPFYERIWLAIEQQRGGFEPEELGFWPSLWRGIVSGLRLLVPSVLVGILVFAVGLIPVVGGIIGAVLGALLGGGLLARELLGRPFDGRGLVAREQNRLRRGARARVTGFGVAAYLVFLLPLGAVVAMPVAVVGATLLARELLGEESTPVAGAVAAK